MKTDYSDICFSNNGKLKLLIIVGTRPEIIRLAAVITKCRQYFDCILAHTGQNYDYNLNGIFFKDLKLKDPEVYMDAVGDDLGATVGNIINCSYKLMVQTRPDALLILGDTNSCLSAIAAKRLHIPIFHMEAGNRCFDQRVPEEVNRKIVDHLSDINMPLSEHARRYLLSEGLRPETIIKTGSPMTEVLAFHEEEINKNRILERESLKKGEYFIVSAHREENIDSPQNFSNLLDTLSAIVQKYKKKVIVSTHPRTKKKLESIGFVNNNPLIEFMKPFGFLEYVKMEQNAFCVISDSGTITEESSILHFPAIMIRQAHERPEGMDEASVVMSGLRSDRVIESIDLVTSQYADDNNSIHSIKDYAPDNVSKKVVRIILSYTDYVNRVVWHKNEN